MPVYPITFSIPRCKIIDKVPEKIRVISKLIPGVKRTYIYDTEEEYYKQYQESIFAFTTKKAGWDCLRHYEILANGCIPVFYGIDTCPENTLSLFPKSLILECIDFYEEYKDDLIEDIPYIPLITKLLNYTQTRLTTENIVGYIMDKIKNSDISDVLFLSGKKDPDYLRDLTLHGFKSVFKEKCHDYPKIEHIYKCKENQIDKSKLYGKGITYTDLLDHKYNDPKRDQTIEDDIKNNRYDLIIYGNYHRGMPKYDTVLKSYNVDQVILMCGEDIHNCNYYKYNDYLVFVRELT